MCLALGGSRPAVAATVSPFSVTGAVPPTATLPTSAADHVSAAIKGSYFACCTPPSDVISGTVVGLQLAVLLAAGAALVLAGRRAQPSLDRLTVRMRSIMALSPLDR